MDRVGFEPTTSAMPRLTTARRSKVIDTIQPAGQIFSPLQIVIVVNLDFNHKVIESIFQYLTFLNSDLKLNDDGYVGGYS
jgi:hypothetical protein